MYELKENYRNILLKHFTKPLLWVIERTEYPILDEPYGIRYVFEEIAIMGDDETRAIEVFEHVLDDIFRVEIEMVRWFIHDDDMWFSEKHLREGDLGSLAS